MVFVGTSFVTTLPAPMMAFSPTVTPQSNDVVDPIEAPFLIKVGIISQSSSVCNFPSEAVERGYLSLIKVTEII